MQSRRHREAALVQRRRALSVSQVPGRRFNWPQVSSGSVSFTPAQLSMLLDGIRRRAQLGLLPRPPHNSLPQFSVLDYGESVLQRVPPNYFQKYRSTTLGEPGVVPTMSASNRICRFIFSQP